MVSRRWLAVIVVIVSLGLLGPLSFIAEEGAKNNTLATATPTASAPSAPVVLGQVLEYTAEVTAEITEVQPALIAMVASESGEAGLNASLSMLENASLYSLSGDGGSYTAVFLLDNASSYGLVLGQLSGANATLLSYAMPAEIALPSSFTAYRNGVATEMSPSAGDEISALVSGSVLSGPANFTLQITKAGTKKKIVAVES